MFGIASASPLLSDGNAPFLPTRIAVAHRAGLPLLVLIAAVEAARAGAAPPAGPVHLQPGWVCCPDDAHLLPPRFRALFAQARPVEDTTSTNRPRTRSAEITRQSPVSAAYTPAVVAIDPLGAPGEVPWTVHATTFRVRSGPSTTHSQLGTLTAGNTVTGVYHLVAETDEEWIRFTYNGNPDAWVSATGVYRPHPLNIANISTHGNLAYGSERVNRWWANPSTYEPTDLATIPPRFTTQVSGRSYQLRTAARDATVAMLTAAEADGVVIRVGSPYRSWASQKSIYTSAVNNDGLNQRYSAPPGHSEHQLGATMDFSYGSSGSFLDNNTPEHNWLKANGARFGFRQSYTAENVAQTGYVEEPWHWRYWGPPAAAGDSLKVQ